MKQVIYIANSKDENIEVWNLSENGQMNLLQKIHTYGQVQPLNIMYNKKCLYAGIRPENKIITYSIQDNGCLKKKHETSIPGTPNYISVNKTNEFLFCSSYHFNCISVSPINKDGIPQDPIQIIYDIKGCHAAKINDKYNILFVVSLKEDRIYLYHLTSLGILKNTENNVLKMSAKSGPRHIIFHPNQDFMYTINELNGTIDVWKIYKRDHIINIKNIQNINIFNKKNFSTVYWSADIHITSCGRFLYVSDRFFNTISLFHIQKNNTIIFFKSYDTEEQPRSFCIDFSDSYVIISSETKNIFSIYRILKNSGELQKIHVYDTGERPLWVLAHKLN